MIAWFRMVKAVLPFYLREQPPLFLVLAEDSASRIHIPFNGLVV